MLHDRHVLYIVISNIETFYALSVLRVVSMMQKHRRMNALYSEDTDNFEVNNSTQSEVKSSAISFR
jgi:hypothetical protein